MAGGLTRRGAWASSGPGPLALAALVLLVLLAHGWVTELLAEQMAGLGVTQAMPARMEVTYVRDMAMAMAPVAAPAAPVPPRPAAVAGPARAASAPERAASRALRDRARVEVAAPAAELPFEVAKNLPADDLPPVDEPPPAAEPWPPTPQSTPQAVAMAASEPAPAPQSTVAPFDWPESTRMSYKLTGNVRGEVHGDAQVEWIRVGSRYQVHLDLTVGLSFAPLMTRRMSSDGDITPEGLSPRRYDQDTKVGFGARQRVAVQFEPDAVVLANGQRRERWPGLQDTASQFIQLTYLFITRPELLRTGGNIEVPLALPRNISRWVYDVLDEEVVYTPIGPITAFHLKPRRAVLKGGDLSAETWFAPQWRYLPVRIRIEQDAETFIDLVIARKPQLAAP